VVIDGRSAKAWVFHDHADPSQGDRRLERVRRCSVHPGLHALGMLTHEYGIEKEQRVGLVDARSPESVSMRHHMSNWHPRRQVPPGEAPESLGP
jgi:hypothetical protein